MSEDEFTVLQEKLMNKLTALQDKFNQSKYVAWLRDLNDEQLRDEQQRVHKELIQVYASIAANVGTTCVTGPATGGLSLAAHGASLVYKETRRQYYNLHQDLCDAELARRGVSKKEISDKELLKTVGKGVLRTVIPAALFD